MRICGDHSPEVFEVSFARVAYHHGTVSAHFFLDGGGRASDVIANSGITSDLVEGLVVSDELRDVVETNVVGLARLVHQDKCFVSLDELFEYARVCKHRLGLRNYAFPTVFLDLQPHLQHVVFASALNGHVPRVQTLVLILPVWHEEVLRFAAVGILHHSFVATHKHGCLQRGAQTFVEVPGDAVDSLQSAK